MNQYLLLLIPILNAAFGWWVIETLFIFLFRPFDEKKFAGMKVQGIIPSLQTEIADKAGEWVEENFSPQKLENFLLNQENRKEIHSILEAKADDFIRNKLTDRISLLKMFITETIIVQAKEVLVEQLDEMIPDLVKNFSPKISASMNIRREVQSRIASYPVQHIEQEVNKRFRKKILFIKCMAAFIGLLIGFLEISLLIV
ncbi:MAG TPA: hypothetical protein DCQ93_05690 [Bacteroidetes bacterium]|nr:hypothetical protein [Bacteroidota bacterium]